MSLLIVCTERFKERVLILFLIHLVFKEAEEAKRRKKQQLSKAMIEDLKRQHLDTPEEVFEREDVMRKKQVG